jgi:hypothetical protein
MVSFEKASVPLLGTVSKSLRQEVRERSAILKNKRSALRMKKCFGKNRDKIEKDKGREVVGFRW